MATPAVFQDSGLICEALTPFLGAKGVMALAMTSKGHYMILRNEIRHLSWKDISDRSGFLKALSLGRLERLQQLDINKLLDPSPLETALSETESFHAAFLKPVSQGHLKSIVVLRLSALNLCASELLLDSLRNGYLTKLRTLHFGAEFTTSEMVELGRALGGGQYCQLDGLSVVVESMASPLLFHHFLDYALKGGTVKHLRLRSRVPPGLNVWLNFFNHSVSTLRHLQTLDISEFKVLPHSVEELTQSIEKNGGECLSVLRLSHSLPGDAGAIILGMGLRCNKMEDLRELDLRANEITAVGGAVLMKALAQGSCPKILDLNLGMNQHFFRSSKAAVELSRALRLGCLALLKSLSVRYNKFTAGTGRLIITSLTGCPGLEVLDLEGCDIGGSLGKILDDCTAKNEKILKKLRVLNLAGNDLGKGFDLRLLGRALRRMRDLEYLNLSRNSFEDVVPFLEESVVGKGTEKNSQNVEIRWTRLLFNGSAFGDSAIEVLVKVLLEGRCKCLEQLSIEGNSGVSDRAAKTLSRLVHSSGSPRLSNLAISRARSNVSMGSQLYRSPPEGYDVPIPPGVSKDILRYVVGMNYEDWLKNRRTLGVLLPMVRTEEWPGTVAIHNVLS